MFRLTPRNDGVDHGSAREEVGECQRGGGYTAREEISGVRTVGGGNARLGSTQANVILHPPHVKVGRRLIGG